MELTDRLDIESINMLIEHQLEVWEEARLNFFKLKEADRKIVRLDDIEVGVQCNPARIRSTGAAVDSKSISERPCFLCKSNRPTEQITIDRGDRWELLVNPYPILPVHFTIVSKRHEPQSHIPLDMAVMAENAPDLVIFYNGSRAGASAPDHLHLQGVLKSELPLTRLVEEHHSSAESGFMSSERYGKTLPYHFVSGVIRPDAKGMEALAKIPGAFGVDGESGKPDRGLVNAFFWIGNDGWLRVVIVPRRGHRPRCYNAEGAERYVISPGCIDMAGLIIAPRREDFERIDGAKIREIYSEVAYSEGLPEKVKAYFEI